MPARRIAFAIVAGLAVLAAPAAATAAVGPTASTAALGSPREIASGLNVPWGIAFLPNGDALVSERATGRIKRIPKNGGTPRTVKTIPGVAKNFGEGGLLGIAVSPNYSRDRLVYAYYTSSRDNRVVRFQLGGRSRTVIKGINRAGNHNGGRIAFGPDGKLYIGTGDAGNRQDAQDRQLAERQDPAREPRRVGPGDNPFGSPVWSYGHRNVQGLSWDSSGRLWATEFGQDTKDEINLIQKGNNYGWPNVEGDGDTQGGRYTNPLVTWSPSEASPSGDAVVGSTLYVGALRGARLWQVPLNGASAGSPTSVFENRYGASARSSARPAGGRCGSARATATATAPASSGDDRIYRVAIR